MGRIISLYAEAAKLQVQAKISNVIWTVPVAHESMVNFVKHRWAPYLASIGETKGTFKFLRQKLSQQLTLTQNPNNKDKKSVASSPSIKLIE